MAQVFQMADKKWFNPTTQQLGATPESVATPSVDTMNIGANAYAYDRTGEAPASETNPVNTLYQSRTGETVDLNKITTTRGAELQEYIREQGLTPVGDGAKTATNQPYMKTGEGFQGSGGSATSSMSTANKSQAEQPIAGANPVANTIENLKSSPLPFSEEQAQLYSSLTGEIDYAAYIGGIGGNKNPLYLPVDRKNSLINSQILTPYQISKATTTNQAGTYWNPGVNLLDIPREDQGNIINDLNKDLLNVVDKGKSESGVLEPKSSLKKLDETLPTQEELFNKYVNTPALNSAFKKVTEANAKVDSYDQMIDELTDDIRAEVKGEAPESYINALAAVRGNKILKLKNTALREYNMALTDYNHQKDMAVEQAKAIAADTTNQWNRTYQMLTVEDKGSDDARQMDSLRLTAMLNLPAGTKHQFSDGSWVSGLKTDGNTSSGTVTEADGSTYSYTVDHNSQKLTSKVFIGKQAVSSSSSTTDTWKKRLEELTAELEYGIKEKALSGQYILVPTPETYELEPAKQKFMYADIGAWEADNNRTLEYETGKSGNWFRKATGYKEFYKYDGTKYLVDDNTGKTLQQIDAAYQAESEQK